ncbi:MAG TPA: hypothetical protein VIX63_03475, partial [Vicinamibacterales bacterium]
PSPADGSTLPSFASPLLTWAGATLATASDVYFGPTGQPPALVAAGLTGTSYQVPGALRNGQTYSWRVVARNDIGATSSATWAFTMPVLDAATTPSPADGSTLTLFAAPLLTWTAVPGATTYHVDFGPAGALARVSTHQAGTSYQTVGTLTNGALYQWRVTAANATGETIGPIWSFTAATLTVPTNPSPAVGSVQPTLATPLLTWTGVAGASGYHVDFGPYTGGSLTRVATNQAGTTWQVPSPLVNGRRYAWQITAVNAGGQTVGPVWWFDIALLEAPHTPSPGDRTAGIPRTAVLSWAAVPGAQFYDVYFGATSEPPLAQVVSAPTTSWDPPDFAVDTQYYWRVVARNVGGSTSSELWTFTTRLPPQRILPDWYRLEANLGVGFRSRLINEANTVGTWPLADLLTTGIARDISGHNYHGSYVGSGFEGGLSLDIPEGAIGTRFTGNGFVDVPDSGQGPFNVSLANGDIDLTILIREYVADATWRGLISKYDTASNNGYYVAIASGAIRFYLRSGGALLFDFTRGSLDSGEHVITAHYQSGDRQAWITIDGVIQGAIETTASSTEPQYTTAPLRIGGLNGNAAGDGSGLRAVLAYASIGREGDATLAASLQATRQWTDLTPHLRTGPTPLEMRQGIAGSGPNDTVATTGTLAFTLDNGPRAGLSGYYTPSHPNVRDGWLIGIPIRLTIAYLGYTHRVFHGRLAAVTPLAGERRGRSVDCVATDWMDVAASSPISALPAQLNRRSDDVARAVIAQAQGRTPVAIEIHAGAGIFPFSVERSESETDTLLTELARVLASERGYLYVRGDLERGGRLVYEGRHDRSAAYGTWWTFDNTMQGLEVDYSLDALINIVRIEYTPRRVDTVPQVLYTLDSSHSAQPIAADGGTLVLEGGYVDPTQEAARVGGTHLIPLVPGVDYGFRQHVDGSGADYTANLRITQTLGGSSFRLDITNRGPAGYLWVRPNVALQIRGLGIYHFEPITVERRNNASVRTRGPRPLQITLPYESNALVAQQIADAYLARYGQERPTPSALTVVGNTRWEFLHLGLSLQIGMPIDLRETMALGTTARYHIQEKRLTLEAPGLVTFTFGLVMTPP